MPTTAVVIAAYNAERTIVDAIDSVLNGTLACDIFVVDDCSRIPVAEVLKAYGDRVTVIRQERNQGPAAARNAALARILAGDYEYVAIQDADDISHPRRMELEARYLDEHPDVGVLSCNLRYIDEFTGATLMYLRRPSDDAGIRKMMFFNLGLSHAGAMIRVEALRRVGLYSLDYPAAEDYELFRRIAAHYGLANLPDVLLDYRVSSQGISLKRRRRQILDRIRTQIKYFDFSQWRAWAGLMKSSLVFFVPVSMIAAYKRSRSTGTAL